MVSRRERTKLMEAFRREPITGVVTLLKGAAGMFVVVSLAIIGEGTDPIDTTNAAANQLPSQRHESVSVSHSRALYQERKARIDPTQSKVVGIEISTANLSETTNSNQKASWTPRDVAPINPLKN